jgi:hypothetical protein
MNSRRMIWESTKRYASRFLELGLPTMQTEGGFDDQATPFAHVNDVKERAPSLQNTLSVGTREGLRYSRLGLEEGGFSADVSSLAEGG